MLGSVSIGLVGHTLDSKPLGEMSSFFVYFYHDKSALGQVFSLGYPMDVSWLIVAVVVDPVQFVILWAPAHVAQELLKILEPSFVDANSSSSVPRILGAIWV